MIASGRESDAKAFRRIAKSWQLCSRKLLVGKATIPWFVAADHHV